MLQDVYPLSPLQQGMLYHSLSARRPGVDVEQILCTLREELDVAAFERAWQRAAQRHDILRTSFRWEGLTGPRQEVHRSVHVPLQQEDWRALSPPELAARFEDFLNADRQRGCDLTAAPLMRLALLRTGELAYRLVWTFHHLLLDGRAFALLLNEVFALTEAFSRGEDLDLQPPRPYRGYIDWLQRLDLSHAEQFWRQHLKGFTAATPLVVGKSAGDEAAGESCGEQQVRFSQAVTATLKSIAQSHQLTLNTLLQGAWALLLSRYSGEEDVVFGAIRACRRSSVEGAESIVGLFINTVPFRVRVLPEARLLRWLANLRTTWLALRPYEHTPLADIQGWAEVPRGAPLFETIFNFQDPSWDAALRAQGGPWSSREFGIRSQSNYPLAVDAYGGDALLIKILYHRPRFDDATIARMLGHLQSMLAGMAANPLQRLADLPLLTQTERHQLLVEWNDTVADFPKEKCVHQLFEEQVQRAPDALAVADQQHQLTYRQLNEQAGLLAHHLQTLGAGPDVRVGVCLDRSVEMVVALLAVLKAGAAHVPLDPAYPRERLAFMIEDAGMLALLTQQALCDRLQLHAPDRNVVCVDTWLPAARLARHDAISRPAPPATDPKDLAYVIYTSGSTGTPKGVEIEHASLVNLIAWHQRAYGVSAADRATQLAAPAFDASVWELWPYLTAGASIHIPNEETRLSPQKLLAWLAAEKITLTFLPTPLAETMMNQPWLEHCDLRALLTGGDKLHHPPDERLPCALFNHYGPTEHTVVTTWTAVLPNAANPAAPPIGRPIANTRVYILDRHLQPAPVGVPGELHISGAGLARGYLNRPELTAAKFVPNPFSRDPQSRLYKTGDLVRWLADGNIEFLGRIDQQVKIRGNRIEIGEIEFVLGRHPRVREAAVIARTGSPGENRLVAYAVPTPGQVVTAGALREYLKEKLPDYMVPSAFVLLEALPLTANGKVDRQALPVPATRAESEQTVAPPATPTEEMLAGIWCAVLNLDRAGIHDNFFDLGGHSLLATQVISRVRRAFQLDLRLADLFEAPTIAGLAGRIESARGAARELDLPPLVRGARDGPPPLSFAQERLWFLQQLEPDAPFNNIPLALRLEGTLHPPALAQALSEIVRRHETLRTTFTNQNGQPLTTIEAAGPLDLPVVDLSALPEAERDAEAQRLMMEEARRPFDLARSPLLRVKLLRLAGQEHRLLLTTHHIACDGWSMGVFYRELAALYEAFVQARPSPLPELPIAYADFAGWQRQWLQGERLEKQLGYWKDQLRGVLPVLDLPADRPRPALQSYRGASQCFALPAPLAVALRALARREEVTLFMLLLAAFQTLLHRYSGQEDILVGSPIAGRTRVETENLIGFFLNTLVLRGDLSGDPPFREWLRRVRQIALDAYAHQDLPFEKLVDALQPERDLSRSPLFQVMFILQNEPLQPMELAGLKLRALPVHSGTAKFELTLSLEENADGLAGFVEYDTELFDSERITRMLAHFQTLLEGIAADPQQRLSALPLLKDAERAQLLVEWNDTRADYPKDQCLHHFFEDQVQRAPEAVAVVFADQQLTYRELNQRADGLAAELRALGVGPDVRVALCVRRSLEMMVGLLGILKAGGCYVPLDPEYPKARLAFMLADSQAPVMVTQDRLQAHFKFEAPQLKLLCLDAPRFSHAPALHPAGVAQEESKRPAASGKSKPTDLAYLIYTSGSTGQPKGVMVAHRNVVNFFAGMDRVIGAEPGVWLAVTSISFDISVLELFWTLARGFKVILQPDEAGLSTAALPQSHRGKNGRAQSLPEQILRHGVTHLQCTPSLARTLVLAPESLPALRSLRRLLLGGEALPPSLAQQLHDLLPGRLYNLYGPTETTVWSAAHRLDQIGNPIPIGRPIANTEIYLLDRHQQPVPVGLPGELLIGGDGVARGYLNRPELTAEKFIRHPFRADPDARLYRTGDLARYRPDGAIEFLGRIDHQVKLRGHRIELGEIEAVLARASEVREAVVTLREDVPGDERLAAYLVASPERPPAIADLRRLLREKLPSHMIPSAFVFLDRLPLTPNGKVDRRKLPEPEKRHLASATAYVSPRTELEKTIAKIWQELLRVEKVGLHDNFFDLGGHSLLVVQAQARLRDALGVDLAVVTLFQYPTISSLAGFLTAGPEAVPFQKIGVRAGRQRAVLARRKREEIVA